MNSALKSSLSLVKRIERTAWFSRSCTKAALTVSVVFLTGCFASTPSVQHNHYDIVTSYVDAYNEGNIGAMSALMHPEIQWLNLNGDQVAIIADGKKDLVAQMNEYVSSQGATTSTLSDFTLNTRFVAVKETARWEKADGSFGVQSALAVYEIETDLVRRVWYYPTD